MYKSKLIIPNDPFKPAEMENVINKRKQNKGYIGISPGLIKYLPVAYIFSWYIQSTIPIQYLSSSLDN